MRRMVTAVLVSVVLAGGFVVAAKAGPVDGWDADGTFIGSTTITAFEEDDFVMNCQQIWPFC